MRTAISREPSEGSPTELQTARRGCTELGPQVEGIVEGVAVALQQATQELQRLEAQRDELRRATRDAPPPVLSKLLERIEEQGQSVRRLERASRELRELRGALGVVGDQLQRGLERQEEARHEHEALVREEKRMWLRELMSLRQRLESAGAAAERPRVEHDDLMRLRDERDRLALRVSELERDVSTRDETLQAKEQTLADLRRMILLLSPENQPASERAPVAAERVPMAAEPRPRTGPRPPEQQLFGEHTIQLAHHMLDTLGPEGTEPAPPPPPSPWPERRPTSREIRFGPLDEFAAGPASLPPPVPTPSARTPSGSFPAVPPPAMARAGVRGMEAARPTSPPPPMPPAPERPGTLVISEDMFNDVLAEQGGLGPPFRK